jgi:hypothetical protein
MRKVDSMADWDPSRLQSDAYKAAIGQLLAQFMYGEEVSFRVAPAVMERFDADRDAVAALEGQLEDEKRHHGMFDEQRRRLGLPAESPDTGILDLGDRIYRMMRDRDYVGLIFTGSFMLEGLGFTTLSAYSEISEPVLAGVLTEIMADEGRHITLNMSLLKRLLAEDPRVAYRLVELHREALPDLNKIYTTKTDLAREAGLDSEWLLTRSLFHHAQRVRRLRLPDDAAHAMLEDGKRALANL